MTDEGLHQLQPYEATVRLRHGRPETEHLDGKVVQVRALWPLTHPDFQAPGEWAMGVTGQISSSPIAPFSSIPSGDLINIKPIGTHYHVEEKDKGT